MNNGGTTPPCRRRKQALQLVKSIEFYLRAEDGHEEIDTLLDKTLDCLAEVSVAMNGYWRRAVDEREQLERQWAKEQDLLAEARKHSTVITPEIMKGLREKAKIREYLGQLPIKEREAFLFAVASTND